MQFTDHCLLRVGIIGVTLMALLAGFGSARIIWNSWVGAPKYVLCLLSSTYDLRNITEVDVTRAKTAIDMTEELITQKRKTIQSLEKTLRDKVKMHLSCAALLIKLRLIGHLVCYRESSAVLVVVVPWSRVCCPPFYSAI